MRVDLTGVIELHCICFVAGLICNEKHVDIADLIFGNVILLWIYVCMCLGIKCIQPHNKA